MLFARFAFAAGNDELDSNDLSRSNLAERGKEKIEMKKKKKQRRRGGAAIDRAPRVPKVATGD